MTRIRLLALVLACAGASLLAAAMETTSAATPIGPVSTGGAHPLLDGALTVAPYQSTTLVTTPADQAFVLTRLCVNATTTQARLALEFRLGSTLYFRDPDGWLTICGNPDAGALGQGRGTVPIPAGSTFSVYYPASSSGDPAVKLYFEGYYAHP